MWKVVTSSNLKPSLKLYFYSQVLINNNLLLKIYCENIVVAFFNQDFLFFTLFFLSFISFSSIRFISFFLVFLLHTHVQCPISIPPPPSFIFFFSPIQEHSSKLSFSLFSLQLSLSLSLSLDSRTFTSSLCDKKRKKRGIKRKNKRDGSFCRRSSSSPSQSKWVRWLLSSVFFFIFFFFFFLLFCFYCYDLINFKIVFLSFYFDNLIMLEFRDV